MRKLSFVILCGAALMSSLSVSAENMRLGLRAGVNLVNNDVKAFERAEALNKDNYTGFFVGPTLQFNIPFSLGLDISALYSQKGMELPDGDNFKQQNIAVPVLLNYTLGLGDVLGVFVQAGPQINFNVGDTKQMVKSTSAEDFYQSYVLEKSTWSFNIGGGVKLMKNLQFAINYNMPLSKEGVNTFSEKVGDIDNPFGAQDVADEYTEVAREKFKSSTLQFSLTYMF